MAETSARHAAINKLAKTFTKMTVQYAEPRAAFDMYVAIWNCRGRGEVVIGAPTLEKLAERWREITGIKLEEDRAQHVIVTYFSVPEAIWQETKQIAAESSQAEELP